MLTPIDNGNADSAKAENSNNYVSRTPNCSSLQFGHAETSEQTITPKDRKNSFIFTAASSGPGTKNLAQTMYLPKETKSPKLKYFSTGPFIVERDFNAMKKSVQLQPQFNQPGLKGLAAPTAESTAESIGKFQRNNRALSNPQAAGTSNTTSPQTSLYQSKQQKRLKNHTFEFLKLQEQLQDDKNFIFSSQSKFGFNSKLGYNFYPKKFNKHLRGLGNNRLFLESLYGDRQSLQQMIAEKNQQSSRKQAAK